MTPANKIVVQAYLDKESHDALEREIHARYPYPDKRCTKSSLINEIIRSHYSILFDNGTI